MSFLQVGARPEASPAGLGNARVRVIDFRNADAGDAFEADLCIIGSGFAGVALARELADARLRVLMVESGGLVPDAALAGLDEIESVGAPRQMDPSVLRARGLGGTSSIWTGRCGLLDPIDYQARPWAPGSGWPFGPETIAPYAERASDSLGLGPHIYGPDLWRALRQSPPQPAFDADALAEVFWQFSRDRGDPLAYADFGRLLLRSQPDNLSVLTNATAVEVLLSEDGSRVAGARVADISGRRGEIRARGVVVACGGVENARLLLASRSRDPRGVGNAGDSLGRYLMDHPRTTFGRVDVKAAALRDRLGAYRHRGSGSIYVHGVALAPALQRREGLLNCAAWLTEIRSERDPWRSLRRLLRDRTTWAADAGVVLANLPALAGGAWRRYALGRTLLAPIDELRADCMSEQTPDRDSRIMLADRADPLGTPLARIDWRIGELERASTLRLARLARDEFARVAGAAMEAAPWVESGRLDEIEFYDPAHPIGATRMSAGPSTGVVDADCRVHGVQGLYVAGSSVFPTAGHVNPTLMIVALAIRLADHLRAALALAPATVARASLTPAPAATAAAATTPLAAALADPKA